MFEYILTHWSDILGWVVTILALVFGGGSILVLLPKLPQITNAGFDWLKKNAEIKGHEAVSAVLQRVIVFVRTKVLEYENTFVEDLKSKAADGALNGEELKQAYETLAKKFRDDMKEMLTLAGLWDVFKSLMGGGTEAGAFKVLDTLKEAAVAQLPPSGLQTTSPLSLIPSAMEVGAEKAAVKPVEPAPAVPPPAAA